MQSLKAKKEAEKPACLLSHIIFQCTILRTNHEHAGAEKIVPFGPFRRRAEDRSSGLTSSAGPFWFHRAITLAFAMARLHTQRGTQKPVD